VIVLSEVKGSVSDASPPEVVGDMASKLRALVTNRRAILQELTWVRDHASDATAAACAHVHAAFLFRKLKHSFLLAPVLLRTVSTSGAADTGEFETAPASFAPCRIRFHSVLVDEDLFALAGRTYLKARSATRATGANET
jgi:hypothetical protein